jgi:hypothetical protein
MPVPVPVPVPNFPLYESGRVFLFSGHAGSGKTEIAINFALGLSRRAPTYIVDFDIINPYFRTADARQTLEAAGVGLVAPQFAGTNVDVPALPGEVHRLFDDLSVRAVFDVGGDDLGAKAVSSFRGSFLAAGAMHIFVFNARRPMTSTLDRAERAFHEIQASARVPFDAIANNTHMLEKTTESDLQEGLDAAFALAERVSSHIAFSALMQPGYSPASRPVGSPASGAVGHSASHIASSRPASFAAGCAAPHGAPMHAAFLGRLSALSIPVLTLNKHIVMEY